MGRFSRPFLGISNTNCYFSIACLVNGNRNFRVFVRIQLVFVELKCDVSLKCLFGVVIQ